MQLSEITSSAVSVFRVPEVTFVTNGFSSCVIGQAMKGVLSPLGLTSLY
jgi:hypothetical protein